MSKKTQTPAPKSVFDDGIIDETVITQSPSTIVEQVDAEAAPESSIKKAEYFVLNHKLHSQDKFFSGNLRAGGRTIPFHIAYDKPQNLDEHSPEDRKLIFGYLKGLCTPRYAERYSRDGNGKTIRIKELVFSPCLTIRPYHSENWDLQFGEALTG